MKSTPTAVDGRQRGRGREFRVPERLSPFLLNYSHSRPPPSLSRDISGEPTPRTRGGPGRGRRTTVAEGARGQPLLLFDR